MLVTELDIALDVGGKLDAIGVSWLIGGSVASSLLGEPRATADVDLVADLRERHVSRLCAALAPDYYVDEDVVRWAVATRRSFNAIHQATITKVDVFCAKDDELSHEQFARRLVLEVRGHAVPLSSAEDIIIQKLLWFEAGGRVSDRQWRDALGVLRVRAGTLDLEYLQRHAGNQGLTDLLRKLLGESRRDMD